MTAGSHDFGGTPPPASSFRIPLVLLEPHDCVYIPGRTAQMQGTWAGAAASGEAAGSSGGGSGGRGMDPVVFEALLNAGFRRSGSVIYRPTCTGCRACRPLRIDTTTFKPSTSQRRVLRNNADLSVAIGRPDFNSEKSNLYARYLAGQHDRQSASAQPQNDATSVREFLYDSPVTTLEMTYRTSDGALVAVGICDVTANIWSSVYFFWDPVERKRSLGIFGALLEIQMARRNGQHWYHLGYWIENSPTMHYKAQVADHQILQDDGSWQSAIRKL